MVTLAVLVDRVETTGTVRTDVTVSIVLDGGGRTGMRVLGAFGMVAKPFGLLSTW